jgi:hypothetical protein
LRRSTPRFGHPCAHHLRKSGWEGKPDDAHHGPWSPGAVDHTWILDVDGVRVVLVAIEEPGITPAQVDELTDMVESVRFVEPQ